MVETFLVGSFFRSANIDATALSVFFKSFKPLTDKTGLRFVFPVDPDPEVGLEDFPGLVDDQHGGLAFIHALKRRTFVLVSS